MENENIELYSSTEPVKCKYKIHNKSTEKCIMYCNGLDRDEKKLFQLEMRRAEPQIEKDQKTSLV